MPDPINGVNTTTPIGVTTTGQAGGAQGNARTSETSTAPAADTADVGRTAGLLTTIADASGQVPDIDQAKVAELRQAIAAGTYRVDPQQVAKKMLDMESGLPSAGGGQ